MTRSMRALTLALAVALLAAPASAVSGDGVDQDDVVSLLDIEKTTHLTKEGTGTLVFFVNTYDDWSPAVLEKGRIRIFMDSVGQPKPCCADGADYVVLMSKPTSSTAGTTGSGQILGNLFKITDSGLQGKGQVPVSKIAPDKVRVSFHKSRIERRASGRMLWMVRTNVPTGGSGGSEPGVDKAPESGMFDTNTN